MTDKRSQIWQKYFSFLAWLRTHNLKVLKAGKNTSALTLELGDKFTVTGWGKVTNNVQSNFKRYKLFKASARQLRKARIPGVTKTDCENEDLYKGYIDTKTQLCAGGEKGIFLWSVFCE